jgi:hypothetical protein
LLRSQDFSDDNDNDLAQAQGLAIGRLAPKRKSISKGDFDQDALSVQSFLVSSLLPDHLHHHLVFASQNAFLAGTSVTFWNARLSISVLKQEIKP